MRLRNEERGQALILVTLAMFMIIAMAAFAIDVAGWYQKHHQAQVTADAAALAAANYMGNGGTAGSATSTATTYASDNGIAIANANVTVDTTAENVTVTVPTTAPTFFAGISAPAVSARAVASWAVQDCTVASNRCAFIYAADNVCTGGTTGGGTGVTGTYGNGSATFNHGVTFVKNGTGSGVAITGATISASNITLDDGGGPTFGTAAYSNGSADCSIGTRPTPTTSNPSPFTAIYQESIASHYPVDYSQVYSDCGTQSTSASIGPVTCSGPTNYPSYCTQVPPAGTGTATWLILIPTTDATYCDAGTGMIADPSTWNGTINVAPPAGTYDATYIAGTVDFGIATGSTFGPASQNNLLAYAAECNPASSSPPLAYCSASASTSSPAVDLGSAGNATINGDIFAPGGVIDSHLKGAPTITGFLEGWDIVYNVDGTVTGQGPPVSSTDTFLNDQLTQ